MPCLWDFTIQTRPIRKDWYLERLATVLHDVLSSRAQLKGMLEAGTLEDLMESSEREAFLRRGPRNKGGVYRRAVGHLAIHEG